MNEYRQEWKKYRWLVIYWVVIFAAFIPVVVTVSVLSARLFHTDAAFPDVAGSWAFLWVVYFVRICAFNCPRCGKCFIGRWWFGNFFLFRQCAHCGLPRDPNALAVFPSRR